MSVRFAVFASGSGTNLQALLDAEDAGAPYHVAAVVADRPCAAEDRARAKGRPVHRVDFSGMNAAAATGNRPSVLGRAVRDAPDPLLALLRGQGIDGVLLAGFLRLVPRSVCAAYDERMLNVHPSLLPSFAGRGAHGRRVHEAVLASGAAVSGPTVHYVDERYDEGRILAQWPVPVLADDTPGTLARRVLAVEHVLFPEAAAALARSMRPGARRPSFRWPGVAARGDEELRAAVRSAFAAPVAEADG